jgi:hypothetical protein
MNKAHTSIGWKNYPSDETPVNETNLGKMDGAIDTIDDRVIALDTTKATKTEVATLVADVTFEESTGIITIAKKNGSKVTIDTQLEKIAVNFDYDPTTEQIILTLIDGTKQYIDLSALITQYEFLDTDTVTFTVGTDGKVSASVKEGSIEEKHLEPNYLAKIKIEVAKAETSRADAAASATKAESYAVGGTGTRTGEDTDNSKYYKEQAERIVAGLNGSLLPMGTITFSQLPANPKTGYMYNVSDEFVTTKQFREGSGHTIPAGTNVYYTADGYWDCMAGSPVTGVKGAAENIYRRGNVDITPANIGLGNVDNTSDANKPVSTAQQRVIDEKYKSSTDYTDRKIAQLINGAPETLDTLKEIADEIAKNKTVVESINAAIGIKANAADVEKHKNEANQLIAQKVSKAGDTMQGPLHFPSGVMNNLGDDCSFGDQDHAGAFCIRGLNGETTLNLIGNDTTAEWCSLRYTNANNDMQLLNLGYINAQTDSGFQVRNHDNSAWNGISAAAFNQQSSRKYKKNIANMDEETARQIMAYRPVTYDYKNEIDGTNCMGLIAEEVAEINTYPVTYQNNKPEAIDYAKFVPQIIKMLQIQQNEINELKNEINALKVGEKDE